MDANARMERWKRTIDVAALIREFGLTEERFANLSQDEQVTFVAAFRQSPRPSNTQWAAICAYVEQNPEHAAVLVDRIERWPGVEAGLRLLAQVDANPPARVLLAIDAVTEAAGLGRLASAHVAAPR